jgi:excinuclease ABC subunit A
MHGGYAEQTGKLDKLVGDFKQLTSIEMIDQNPIGRWKSKKRV